MLQSVHSLQTRFFQSGATLDWRFRKKKLHALKRSVLLYENQLYDALQKDFGKSSFETLVSEFGMVLSALNDQIKNLKKRARDRRVWPAMVNFPSTAKIRYEPYGKVLVISPWNYPFNLALIPLIEAMAAGNTVVLKPSEYVPHINAVIQKIISGVFEPGHVSMVEGDARTARALLELRWDYIFFTGSPQVGKYVYAAAAKHLTPVTLELGGKSPAIVDETAHLRVSARRIAWGKFLNAGQTCIAPDYVLVHEKKADVFLENLKKSVREFYGENPYNSQDYTRIINRRNFDRLKRYLENQNIVYGGQTVPEDLYFSPTVIFNPALDSEVMQDEIFGPVLPVLTYGSKKELLAILRKNPDPLALYIFSNDKKFQREILNRFPSGDVTLNDTVIHFVNKRLPFGGIRNSGMGVYHGKHGFETFSHKRSVVKRGWFPDIPLRYPPSRALKKTLAGFFLTGRWKKYKK